MKPYVNQPIIILGGFFLNSSAYKGMKEYLKSRLNNKVEIVSISKLEWLCTNLSFGWTIILNKVEKVVKELSQESSTNKDTLIGHSSGGMILRLFLSDHVFDQKVYNGKNLANYLKKLGSPNQAKGATSLRDFYSKYINYISFADELDLNGANTTRKSLD